MTRKQIEKKVFDGKCYNFALGFVNDWLVQQGRWNHKEVIDLSSRLSREIQKTVNDFNARRPITK